MRKVLFVTTGLATGGAEKMLAKLLSRLHGRAIDAGVVSLMGRGAVSTEIEALGVPVWHLGLDAPWRLPMASVELARIVRRFGPGVIQGWMYHGNLAAFLACVVAPASPRLCWGIRQSLYDLAREKPGTRVMIRLGAHLSSRAEAIVYNSEAARRQHESFGYAASRALVIDNGFDSNRFHPDTDACRAVRGELGLAPETIIVGLIARYHPMKGHKIFLQAASMLAERMSSVHFLLVGRGVVAENSSLAPWFSLPVLQGRVHLLGERQDIPRITAALDIASSSSWGEAFPNAVGEAMACGVPVVATDVGDVRRIVGEAGLVVPVGDAEALASAWKCLLEDKAARRRMGEIGRQRVIDEFSIDAAAQCYAELYEGMMNE